MCWKINSKNYSGKQNKKTKETGMRGKEPNKEVQQLIGILEKKNENDGYEGMVEENFITEMKK